MPAAWQNIRLYYAHTHMQTSCGCSCCLSQRHVWPSTWSCMQHARKRRCCCEYSFIYIAEIAEPTQIHEFIHDVRASASGQRPSFTQSERQRERKRGRESCTQAGKYIKIIMNLYIRQRWVYRCAYVCVHAHAKCVKLSRSAKNKILISMLGQQQLSMCCTQSSWGERGENGGCGGFIGLVCCAAAPAAAAAIHTLTPTRSVVRASAASKREREGKERERA